MSRHRNVRSMNYSDEYDGYDDVYGHSVEDDSCISPSDAAFMYDRSNRQTQISAFITEEDDIEEVDEDIEPEVERRHSDSFRYPELSDVDEARLRSCLDEIHSVIGDSIPENIVVETVIEKNFDLAQALDALLKSSNQRKQEAPKPQREKSRRPRPVEKDDYYFSRNLPEYQVRAIVENNRNLKFFPSLSGCRTEKYKKEVLSSAKDSCSVTRSSSDFFNVRTFTNAKDLISNSDSHRLDHTINNTNLKSLLNSANLKMDSFTDSGPEEVLILGVKHNKVQQGFNSCPYDTLKPNGDIGIEVASKYIGKHPEPYNPQGPSKSVSYSSDDDSDTEFSSMSLVALAAKHKNNTPSFSAEKPVLVSSKIDLPSTLGKNQFVDSSDSSSETEGSSLFTLMRKIKVEETNVVDGCIDIKDESKKSSNSLNRLPVEDSIDLKLGKVNNYLLEKTHNLRVEEMTTKFVAAHFSDDSDSDEPLLLVGLALKHAKTVNHEGSGSADDVRSAKPNIKELQNLANYHRQHTKSESDRFSSSAVHPSDNLLKKNLENNVSSSLRNLRGGGHQEMGWKFSPGGSIPGSFKSLNASNSLNSSLTSIEVETASKCLGSDSDVSIGSSYFENVGKKQDPGVAKNVLPFYSEKKSEHFLADAVDGGINLSCALKKSNCARTSERSMSENSVEIIADAEDEQILTLLDSLMVDEEAVEEGKVKKRLLSNSELDESCTIDVSHLLKVRVKLRTRKCSSFGKVVCRQWRSLGTPYIRKDKQKTSVIPFDFAEPSPDDVIAYAFKRRL